MCFVSFCLVLLLSREEASGLVLEYIFLLKGIGQIMVMPFLHTNCGFTYSVVISIGQQNNSVRNGIIKFYPYLLLKLL